MILFKNCSIADVKNGRFIDRDILIEGEKIKEVSNNIDILDENIEIIDIKNNKVFPGFIDGHSHIGMWTLNYNGNDANECIQSMTPSLRAIDGLNPQDRAFESAYKAGITTIMICPGSGNVIGGQAAIIKSCGKTIEEKLMKFPAALKVALGENPKNVYSELKMSPSSRMSTASLLREKFEKAKLYLEEKEQGKLVEYDMDLEAIIPVMKKEIPLKIHSHRSDDTITGINIAKEFGLKATLDHCTEGYLIIDKLKEVNFPIMVGPLFSFRTKDEVKNATYENPIELIRNGLNISVVSDHPFSNCEYLPIYVGLLVKYGMDYFDAIKTITINPAMALGIDNRVGSIESSKDGDLVIFDGDPLEISTKTLLTMINGRIVYRANK
mgnify:CR=1 FL=1